MKRVIVCAAVIYPVVGYLKKNIENFVAMGEQSKVKYVQDFLIDEVLK